MQAVELLGARDDRVVDVDHRLRAALELRAHDRRGRRVDLLLDEEKRAVGLPDRARTCRDARRRPVRVTERLSPVSFGTSRPATQRKTSSKLSRMTDSLVGLLRLQLRGSLQIRRQ